MSTPAISLGRASKHFRVPLDHSTTLKYRFTHWRSAGRYRTLHALDEVTFDVPHGQFLGIIGHNGCGKSTLLKILSRIYTADSGSVAVDGRVSPFLELGVGFNPELTARENVFLNGALLGLTRRELRGRIDGIIAFAELEEFADQKLKNFSSGMQVRLAFSVAIQADAGILLMDEVLAVGDARFQEKCFDVFARYKREGRTVILVTHDLGSVERYCDRAILLDHGRLVDQGLPGDVTTHYRRMVGALAEASPVDELIEPKHDRGGTREVEVTEVRLYDGRGKERHTFGTSSALVVEIEYAVRQPVRDLVCGIAVLRSDGLRMGGSNTLVDGLTVTDPEVGSRGVVRYAIESLNLLDASYDVEVALHDLTGAHLYDHLLHAAGFRAVDERGRQSLIELGGHWELMGSPSAPSAPAVIPRRRRTAAGAPAAATGSATRPRSRQRARGE